MAESSLSSTILEDFLTCSICLEIFKEPKILPCLHTFCLSCLSKLVNSSSSNILRCPKCRNETPLPEKGTLGLTTNFYIVNLTEVVQTKDSGHNSTSCSFCILKGDNTPAFFKCLDCRDLLCKTCSDRHTLTRLTINHRIVDLSEIRKGKYDDQIRSSQGILCSVHKEEKFQYFCATCDQPVCRDCVLLSHKLHECMTIEDALKSRIGKIRVLMKEVEGCLKNHKADEEILNKQLKELRTEESQLHSLANKLADQVIDDVYRQRQKVKEKITKCFIKPKEEALEKIQKQSLDFCKSILQNGKDVEILSLEELLRKRLTELQSIPRDPKENPQDRKLATLQLASTFEGNQNIFLFSKITFVDQTVQKLLGKQKEDLSKSVLQEQDKNLKTQDSLPIKITPEAKQTTQDCIKREKIPKANQKTVNGIPGKITLKANQASRDSIQTGKTPQEKQKESNPIQREITPLAKEITPDSQQSGINLETKQASDDGRKTVKTPEVKQKKQDET
ncbi:hypothetical protein KUTeg_001157 [Tegillarca granosa]|uniref:Uncharacterized protein n=1 Tax=Tegillarca granosa TaxID=220873 RepID=A0ABQ9FVR6_TEGGR|nr:hypothetical protein KUTeg_001157 [Tegillarca granosa]